MKRTKHKNAGARVHIPAWLADSDKPAPCLCGMPALLGQDIMMVEGELGMKRWFHVSCWDIMVQGMGGDEDEDDDED